MLEFKILCFIPMIFCVSIFLANFYIVSWFTLLPLYLCLPFLVYLGSTLIGSHQAHFPHFQ